MNGKDPTPIPPTLLSESYRELNAELHRREPSYGTTGRRYVSTIRNLAREHGAVSILDYGCGKRDLWRELRDEFDVRNYDPAIPEFAASPEPAEFVACIDVLEHIEPEFLANVLADIRRVTLKVTFITIATQLSGKQLADGTNCHRIVQSASWWQDQLRRHFQLAQSQPPGPNSGLLVIGTVCTMSTNRIA
jgi:hypothetical protein